MNHIILTLAFLLCSSSLFLEGIQIIGEPIRIQYERSPQEIQNQQMEIQNQQMHDASVAFGNALGTWFRKRQEEKDLITYTRHRLFVEDLVESYSPDRHFEFVESVNSSDLPENIKMILVHRFNKEFKEMFLKIQ